MARTSSCAFFVVWSTTISAVDLRGRQLGETCDQGNVEALLEYEQKLMQDFSDGKSLFGRMCFDTTQGAEDSEAQARWILGMKSYANFAFDLCKHTFKKLTQGKPNFMLGYFGLALCNAQLVWNSEAPVESAEILRQGRSSGEDSRLNDQESAYYSALEALNSYDKPHKDCPLNDLEPSSEAGIKKTRPCRYQAFLDRMTDLSTAYPDDSNSGAFAILGHIASSAVVKSEGVPASRGKHMQAARALAHHLAFETDTKNPAVLHFGLHAHDYPDRELYEGGFPFAVEYPLYVNGSCHSVHMPSHIWDRAGIFDLAEKSNFESVRAADYLAQSGALAFDDGDFGSKEWTPGQPGWIAGLGFANDAGNLYHSLEYQQYEYLHMCNFAHARRLTDRMATAALQAFAAVGPAGNFGDSQKFAEAWRDSTTYWQFLYRMEARFTQSVVMFRLLGGVGNGVPELGSIGFKLPLPLSWSGIDVYAHNFYSPQSEAGTWAAVAMDRLMMRLGDFNPHAPPAPAPPPARGPPTVPDDKQLWMMSCSDEPVGRMIDCIDSMAAMAVKRIRMVHQKYIEEAVGYESDLTRSVLNQVQSLASLVSGDAAAALRFAEKARDDEYTAEPKLLSTSTSLYFIPGHAWHGLICLRLLHFDAAVLPKTPMEILTDAKDSFVHCLSPAGRPNHTACLLGLARTEEKLWEQQGFSGHSPKAKDHYKTLLDVWGKANRRVPSDPSAAVTCNLAWNEAGGTVHMHGPIAECGDGTELVGGVCVASVSGVLLTLLMFVMTVVGAVVGLGVGWFVWRKNAGATGHPRYNGGPEVEVQSFTPA